MINTDVTVHSELYKRLQKVSHRLCDFLSSIVAISVPTQLDAHGNNNLSGKSDGGDSGDWNTGYSDTLGRKAYGLFFCAINVPAKVSGRHTLASSVYNNCEL